MSTPGGTQLGSPAITRSSLPLAPHSGADSAYSRSPGARRVFTPVFTIHSVFARYLRGYGQCLPVPHCREAGMACGLCPGRPLPRPSNWPLRWVQIPVDSPIAGDGGPVPPRQDETGLAGLAAFTLDSRGRVASWPETAARLFGRPAQAVVGHDVREVLM